VNNHIQRQAPDIQAANMDVESLYLFIKNLMKNTFLSVLIVLQSLSVVAQSTIGHKFALAETVILPTIRDKFHGLSGIDFNADKKEWTLVNDRGHYFKFNNCAKASDFKKDNLKTDIQTGYFFESIRYDPISNAYFFSVETDTYTAVYYSQDRINETDAHLILKVPLPATNKGVEAIAITPSGSLWIAPEAGWENETDSSQEYVHFYRYKNPMVEDDTEQPERFRYEKSKFPGANYPEDRLGGISDILAIDENHLLILERGYYKNPKEEVKATLKTVRVDTLKMKLEIEDAYTFDFKGIPNLCNIEGMTWGDAQKKTLYIVADDGLGEKYYSDKMIPGTSTYEKPTLRNQLIILKRE
jgi:hypothetical protein